MLQCVVVRCTALQCVAVGELAGIWDNLLELGPKDVHARMAKDTEQVSVAVCCSALQCAAVCRSVLQCVAMGELAGTSEKRC